MHKLPLEGRLLSLRVGHLAVEIGKFEGGRVAVVLLLRNILLIVGTG